MTRYPSTPKSNTNVNSKKKTTPSARFSSSSAGHTPSLPRKQSSASGHVRIRQAFHRPTVLDLDDKDTDEESADQPIVSVLGEISNMLGIVIRRLEKTESKLESVEQKLEASSSAGSCLEQAT